MPIKARPFKTQIDEIEVEGFIEGETFVFRIYGVRFLPPVLSFGEDALGQFAILQETEISYPDGFVFTVAPEYDADLGCEWGYQVSLKRNETGDRDLLDSPVKLKGLDPNSVNSIIRPRQLISVYFDPHGVKDGSAQLDPVEGGGTPEDPQAGLIRDRVRSSGAKRVLFVSHAVRQMSRPDRMITTVEVRNVIATGEVTEDYPDDPRGPSCLFLGYGEEGRPIHVVCSPKPDFLAIITAYLPSPNDWSDNFRLRLN